MSSREPVPTASTSKPSATGYQSIFGVDTTGKGKRVPTWLPIGLLAFSTVAMTVPIVMLRRHRATLLKRALSEAPPPSRSGSASAANTHAPSMTRRALARQPPPRRASVGGQAVSKPSWTSGGAGPSTGTTRARPEENINGALQSAKAFGIATLMVGAGAMATVWGVRVSMGVQTTQEFADAMRAALLKHMPQLTARIHRALEPEDDAPIVPLREAPARDDVTSLPDVAQTETEDIDASGEWSWPAAEQRLKLAYAQDGYSGWAAAALDEMRAVGEALEGEAELERSRRGQA